MGIITKGNQMIDDCIIRIDLVSNCLIVEHKGLKYRHNKKLMEKDMDYLRVKVKALHKVGSIDSYLAQEFTLLD